MPRTLSPADGSSGSVGVDETTISLLRMIHAAIFYSAETFAYMLETYQGLTPDNRRKLEACRRLELTIAARLADHLTDDLGRQARRPRRARQAAETLARHVHGSWSDRMSELEAVAIRGVVTYRNLKSIHGDRAPNLCATLLAKDMAIRDLARDELDNEGEASLDRIFALLGPEDREAVLRS